MDAVEEALAALSKEATPAGYYGTGQRAAAAAPAIAGSIRDAFGRGIMNVAEKTPEVAVGAAVTAVSSLAIAGVAAGVRSMWGAASKQKNFKQMMELHPDLEEHHRQDPKLFNASFNSMSSLTPHYAADPVIAGGVMRRMLEAGPTGAGAVMTSLLRPGEAPRSQVALSDRFGPVAYNQQI